MKLHNIASYIIQLAIAKIKSYTSSIQLIIVLANIILATCVRVASYRIEGNFGGCKRWRIHYKNTFGEINFGKFEHLECYLVLNKVFWLEKFWQIYDHSPNLPMFPSIRYIGF